MGKYLILVTGTTKNGEPVSLTIHADDIRVFDFSFQYKIISNNMEDDRTLLTWFDINFSTFSNLNILWQSDGFCGHLTKINMGKENTK